MSDPTADPPPEVEPRFEDLLRDLEAVVDKLERGEVPLEEALAEFERGSALATRAGAILDRAEARVTQLIEDREGRLRELPLADRGE